MSFGLFVLRLVVGFLFAAHGASSEEPRDGELVEEEEEAAAAEAARIGGEVRRDEEDPARQPLAEAGEGEAEGFELAERDLEDIASHGDQHRFPGNVPPPPEAATGAVYGEPDQEIHEEE
jgi:hypothetical protein